MTESALPTTGPASDTPPRYRVGALQYTRIGVVMVFFWLLWGDFTFTLMESVVPSILPLKLKDLGAANLAMSFILATIPSAMNFMVNPVISFRSDRYRGRWGRRIPFLFWSTPLVTGALVAMAYSPELGAWLHAHLAARPGAFGKTTVIVATIGVLMVVFQFFNMFISSVYYYLFNDVVPEQYISRFMALFRLVGQLAGMVYSYFIFRYALTHMKEIFLGAAALYFAGFMLMCWRVKEGAYAPPPALVGGRQGLGASIQTYFRECFSHPFYWNYFGFTACLAVSGLCGFVGTLFLLHLGITLNQIGKVAAIMTIPGMVLTIPLGWLADRLKPMRVVAYSMMWFPLMSLASYFLVHDLKSLVILWCVGLPVGAFNGVAVMPLSMVIFPKERYGQFGSADAMTRSILIIVCSLLAGGYMDLMKKIYHGNEEYYRWMYIWQFFFQAASWVFAWRLYAGWKKYGGPDHYVPPSVGPAPADSSTVPK